MAPPRSGSEEALQLLLPSGQPALQRHRAPTASPSATRTITRSVYTPHTSCLINIEVHLGGDMLSLHQFQHCKRHRAQALQMHLHPMPCLHLRGLQRAAKVQTSPGLRTVRQHAHQRQTRRDFRRHLPTLQLEDIPSHQSCLLLHHRLHRQAHDPSEGWPLLHCHL